MTTTHDNPALAEIGRNAMASIAEMVAALTREGAAAAFVADLDADKLRDILAAEEITFDGDADDVDALREFVAEQITDETIDPAGFEFDEDEARQRIQEDALSLEVRSGWYTLDADDDSKTPAEFCLLLATGGPAVRIIGEIDRGSPSRPRLEVQDWFTPWTEYHDADDDALQAYCDCFYFGE